MPFEIHDDNEILKRMGMHNCHLADLPHLVPPALICYTPQFQLAQWRVESRGGVERYHGSLGGDEMGANGDAAGVKTED
ncbi:hypothetical protein T492DRAFT_881497 [Pavlovales sp. CCMP2436]|nr:hypothetical protein T492DRAFT_881497 [Pavlovales sp. CCMP2436]